MAYPVVWSSGTVQGNSYADVQDVQTWLMSTRVGKTEWASVDHIRTHLITVTAEIDAVLLGKGAQVPPPSTSELLPILKQAAAIGAAANLEHARYETGDDAVGQHAQSLIGLYDAQLGLLERYDIPLDKMGMVSAGWLPESDTRKYFSSGNLQPDRTGNAKKPFFTAQDQY